MAMAAPVRPPAPFTPPESGSLDQRLKLIADAISKKADTTLQPTYRAVQLIADDNRVWSLSIDAGGALVLALVPR